MIRAAIFWSLLSPAVDASAWEDFEQSCIAPLEASHVPITDQFILREHVDAVWSIYERQTESHLIQAVAHHALPGRTIYTCSVATPTKALWAHLADGYDEWARKQTDAGRYAYGAEAGSDGGAIRPQLRRTLGVRSIVGPSLRVFLIEPTDLHLGFASIEPWELD